MNEPDIEYRGHYIVVQSSESCRVSSGLALR